MAAALIEARTTCVQLCVYEFCIFLCVDCVCDQMQVKALNTLVIGLYYISPSLTLSLSLHISLSLTLSLSLHISLSLLSVF